MKNLAFILTIIFIYSGCSSKQYYKPTEQLHSYKKISTIEDDIIDYSSTGATLENSKYILKDGISKLSLKDGYKFLNQSDNTILSTNNSGSLSLKNKTDDQLINFQTKIVSVAKKDNILALVFADNSLMLYNINNNQTKYKEYLNESVLNDIQIASPVFLENIVLFPTLDGRIILVNYKNFNKIKNINIDPKGQINNIIYLSNIKDTLVAATDHKIFTFVNAQAHIKDFDIMHLTVKGKYIYLASLDGNIIKLDQTLKVIKKRKFKFAKFVTIGHGDNFIYALDTQGYLVSVDDKLNDLIVFELPYDSDEKVFSLGSRIYFGDKYIDLD